MQLGIVGLGRMGAGIARRLLRAGHSPVVFDRNTSVTEALARDGAVAADSLSALAKRLDGPRAVWLMLPAGIVDSTVESLAPELETGDVIIDGGNSHYHDDIRRAALLAERGIRYLDIGVSGGVHGLERGYCLMIGGDEASASRLLPIFEALAPGVEVVPRTRNKAGAARPGEAGYLYCGPTGAGHFVKMVHNGIEYGLMQAYAEGLNILKHANAGKHERTADAETAPLRHPEHYQYDFDLGAISELWRRGSVISSFLLDLTAAALASDANLAGFEGRVSDSGEGRWTLNAAIDESVPTPVLSTALAVRFASRGEGDFAARVLSALRYEFGGHAEKPK